MSSVKDNVGRGLNIALVNGEFPMEQRCKADWQPATLCPHAHSGNSRGAWGGRGQRVGAEGSTEVTRWTRAG